MLFRSQVIRLAGGNFAIASASPQPNPGIGPPRPDESTCRRRTRTSWSSEYRGFFTLLPPVSIKQPDILMLAVTLPDLFSREVLRANWDYYEPLTDHGSSLSPSIHALVAQ